MRKIEIALCDDQSSVYDTINALLKEYSQKTKIEYTLSYFDKPQNLLNQKKIYDAIFLDIDMPGMDGIELGKRLRRLDVPSIIVMITGYGERADEPYLFGAARFLLKPVNREKFFEAVNYIVKSAAGRKKNIITLKIQNSYKKLKEEKIIYIEANGDYIKVFFEEGDKGETRISYGYENVPLKEFARLLDDTLFFRCHRSYLININYIYKIEEKSICMEDGREIPLSRRRKQELEMMVMNYCR